MGYKFYYRDVEKGAGSWLSAEEDEYDSIVENKAFHVSTLFLSDLITKNKDHDSKIRYRGDMYIDVDNKDVDYVVALEKSISDIKALRDYLISIGVDLKSCELFISGGKGFHLRLPARLFSSVALPNLPLVYKGIAKKIKMATGADGIDMQIYSQKRGSLLRVANKQRSNGNYKVPITWATLDMLDSEVYLELASSPQQKVKLTDSFENPILCSLFTETIIDLLQEEKLNKCTVVEDIHLKTLSGSIPSCVSKLSNFEDIKSGYSGRFNKAKLSFARYIVNCDLSEDEKEALILKFADNAESGKFPRPADREKEIRYAINDAQSNQKEFSCGYFKEMLDNIPCNLCPVRLSVVESKQSAYSIEELGNNYFRKPKGKQSDSVFLGNFRLEPIKISFETTEEGDQTDQVYTFLIHSSEKDVPTRRCKLGISAFQSASKFKEGIKSHPQAAWYGKDDDVTDLRRLVTSPVSLEGVKKVIPVKKQGVVRAVDSDYGIDEYVWVQKGWSWNGELPDSVEYRGPKQIGDEGESTTCAVNLKYIEAKETQDSAHVFKNLLESRGMKEIAILLGWVGCCWLKPRVTVGEMTALFPILHVYGTSGSGKTSTTKAFAVLAGYDGSANETINVGTCTAYFLKAISCTTTTIPHIFDELNNTKISEEVKKAVREAIKSSATKQVMGKGRVVNSDGSGQTATEVTIASSPLIMLSTAQNREEEIIQRSVLLYLSAEDVKQGTGTKYVMAFDEVLKSMQLLFPYTRMLMEKAISLSDVELDSYWQDTAWIARDITDQRMLKGMKCIGMGLQFVHAALKDAGCNANILAYIKTLYQVGIKEYLEDPRYQHLHASEQDETDKLVDTIIGMAQLDGFQGDPLLREGVHYIVDTTMVHFKLNAVYVHFKRMAKEQGLMVEYDSVKGFIQALETRKYYHSTGKAPGVQAPIEWHAFSIQGLIDKNIDVTRLNSK